MTSAGSACTSPLSVQAHARPGQVLVSSTVKDLVVMGLRFGDRGERALKGVADVWRL